MIAPMRVAFLRTSGATICQGNYGGAFPLQYTRSITP